VLSRLKAELEVELGIANPSKLVDFLLEFFIVKVAATGCFFSPFNRLCFLLRFPINEF
jgi:hypothetical protein